MTDLSLDDLRLKAKQLHRGYDAGEDWARQRVRQRPPRREQSALKRADFLHIVAQETGFATWPALTEAAGAIGLDRAAKVQKLKIALYHGKTDLVQELLWNTPDLADGSFALQCALYDRKSVEAALEQDPSLATSLFGPRRPILHLAFSNWIHARPDLKEDMLGVADLLVSHGADVNDGYPHVPGSDHTLSALYGAIGHANNMVLGQWLLDHGANPNDGESLYHATELGHHDGLRMLLAAGADPQGTNAVLRAMDFHDFEAVRMLLAHGARADDYNADEIGGEQPWVVPALHQAARRGSDAVMIDVLLSGGARPDCVYQGATAYAYARVHGSTFVAQAIEARNGGHPLSREEALMARAAEGQDSPGAYIDPAKLPAAYRHLIREILHIPGKLDQVKRLVALGLPYDQPDSEGLTPVQVAGWEGLPDVMKYFLRLKPDLSHVNNYGGTLFSTILHGSENNPDRTGRDYIGCLEMALIEGVALPARDMAFVARSDIRSFLEDWAKTYPGQVI